MNNMKSKARALFGKKARIEGAAEDDKAGEAHATFRLAGNELVPATPLNESRVVHASSPLATGTTRVAGTSKYNFKVVYDPPNPVVDILFLHGLTGDREDTWTRSRGKQSCFWPRDLLPEDITDARIAVWGYDASMVKKTPFSVVSTNTLDHHAQTLCSDIAALRGDDQKRPIIFIVHSLGGLVCKTALLYASEALTTSRSHLRDIYNSTLGIAFMGTPHQGSSLASWGAMLASFLGYVKQDNKAIVETLEKEAPHLNELQKRFIHLLEKRKEDENAIEITCFYEELPMAVVGTIVPSQSATIHGYEPIGIHANHSDMTKFGSDDSEGYRRVRAEVQRWIATYGKRRMIDVEGGNKKAPKSKEDERPGGSTITHSGNVQSGGVGIYGPQQYQHSGTVNIGGVHTAQSAEKTVE